MAAPIAEVREALAAAVEVAGIRCSPYVSDSVQAPCAMVDRRQMDPRYVFQAATTVYRFRLICYFNRTDPRSSQMDMDEFCDVTGDRSIVAAIQDGDNWPDNLIHTVSVVNVGDTFEREIAGVAYLAVEFDIEVTW
jgi:hypothetical protein